jgi:hypothetical protein
MIYYKTIEAKIINEALKDFIEKSGIDYSDARKHSDEELIYYKTIEAKIFNEALNDFIEKSGISFSESRKYSDEELALFRAKEKTRIYLEKNGVQS